MECPNCKKKTTLKLKFCPYCGTLISKKPLGNRKNRTRTNSITISSEELKKEQKKKEKSDLLKDKKEKEIEPNQKENKLKEKKVELKQTEEKIDKPKKPTKTEEKIGKPKTEEKTTPLQKDDKPKDKEEFIENIIKKYDIINPTKYHIRNLNETSEEDIEKAFQRKFDYPAVPELNINHALYSNIYFIYDYIKSQDRNHYKKKNVDLSEYVEECFKIDDKLIKYKYHNKYIPYFTKALFKGIKNIYKVYFKDKDGVALIPVPSSTKDEDPQTKKSIVAIKKGKEDGKYKYDFEILDYSDLLIRNKSVKSSSKGGGRSLEKHYNSIIFNKEKELSDLKLGYILLDDITTSGNIMYACRDILIANGFENEDIISLTIGRTVDDDELIYMKEGLIIEVEPYRVERWNDE